MEPWIPNSGWYWMIYKQKADRDAPLIGIFAGPPSRLLGVENSGPGLTFLPRDSTGNKVAAIEFQSNRRSPDATVYNHVRASWGIFSGVKGKDVGDPGTVQNIAREMNLHGGINLNKVHRYLVSYGHPIEACRPLYMSTDAFQRLVSRVRTDKAYYEYLYNAEPTARNLLDSWRAVNPQKTAAVAGDVRRLAENMLELSLTVMEYTISRAGTGWVAYKWIEPLFDQCATMRSNGVGSRQGRAEGRHGIVREHPLGQRLRPFI